MSELLASLGSRLSQAPVVQTSVIDWTQVVTQLVALGLVLIPAYLKLREAADAAKLAVAKAAEAAKTSVEAKEIVESTHSLVNSQTAKVMELAAIAARQEGILQGIQQERDAAAVIRAAADAATAANAAGVALGVEMGVRQERETSARSSTGDPVPVVEDAEKKEEKP